jgi:hypothetical protein
MNKEKQKTKSKEKIKEKRKRAWAASTQFGPPFPLYLHGPRSLIPLTLPHADV